MKLYKLLFESVDKSEILTSLEDFITNSNSETADFLLVATYSYVTSLGITSLGKRKGVPLYDEMTKNFYNTNKDQFDRILSGAKEFKHLGGGSLGNVFSLGDTILKLELTPKGHLAWASSKNRAEKAASALFSKGKTARKAKAIAAGAPASYAPTVKDNQAVVNPRDLKTVKEAVDNKDIASVVPMIYDQGSFEYPPGSNNTIDWVVMEKFETLKDHDRQDMDQILDVITDRFASGDTKDKVEDINTYSDLEKDIIKNIGPNLRLKDDWFKKLVRGMVKLKKAKIADFHAGNIGIRRIGPEGEFIFFD